MRGYRSGSSRNRGAEPVGVPNHMHWYRACTTRFAGQRGDGDGPKPNLGSGPKSLSWVELVNVPAVAAFE